MIEVVEWVGTLLVIAAVALFASKHYVPGFIAQIASTQAWAFVALANGMNGLLALQVVLFLIAGWGLGRHTTWGKD